MYTRKPTIKQSLLRKIGQIHVEPNQLGIVLQNGRFGRFLQSGGHPPLNPWGERLVKHFAIKVRSVQETTGVSSSDGFEFSVSITVQYRFDPSQAARRHQADMAAIALGSHPDSPLRKKVIKAAITELRHQIALFSGMELMRGGIYEQLEKGVHRHLYRALSDYGISVNMPNSLFLNSLKPPAELVQTMQMSHRQKQIAQMLIDYPQVGVQALQLDILAQQDDAVHHTYGTWPPPAISEEEASPEVQAIILPQSTSNGGLHRHAN